MKRFLKNWGFIIFLAIATFFIAISISSCTVTRTINVYQKYYPGIKEKESITDVYSQLREHEVDSIHLDNWLTLQANNDDGYILQKTVSSTQDKNLWKFIYTKHVIPDSSFYSIRVVVSTKDKKIQKFYGR